jgi:hypothetical protein
VRSDGGCATLEMAAEQTEKQVIVARWRAAFDHEATAALESCVRCVPTDGPVAQLGARLNGIQEVTGSIPVRSTILPSSLDDLARCLCTLGQRKLRWDW